MPQVEIAPGLLVPDALLRFSFARSSGPGGQNVNKVSSKARLHICLADLAAHASPQTVQRLVLLAGAARLNDAGDLVIVSEESRSQSANRQICLDRLRELLLEASRPVRKRRKSKPTRGSNQRRLDAKKQHGVNKRTRAQRPE